MFRDAVLIWQELDPQNDPQEARDAIMGYTSGKSALILEYIWRNGMLPLPTGTADDYVWPHLIYSYSVENTRIYEIFRRIIWEYLHGEKLGTPSEGAAKWIQATVDLWYKATLPYTALSLDNLIRPSMSAIRRNAYYRMFGMDLNHSPNAGEEFVKPKEHNDAFVQNFEKLLREVRVGYVHRDSTTGANPTDDAAIAFLCTKLRQMFEARRGGQGQNLSREEFFAVAMMSWFHLTVDHDSEIVKSANAASSSPHERLRVLGEKVGVPAHSKSEHFFQLSEPASRLMQRIEAGDFDDSSNAHLLYDETDPISYDVQDIITHWSMATGRDIKATTVAPPASVGATA